MSSTITTLNAYFYWIFKKFKNNNLYLLLIDRKIKTFKTSCFDRNNQIRSENMHNTTNWNHMHYHVKNLEFSYFFVCLTKDWMGCTSC